MAPLSSPVVPSAYHQTVTYRIADPIDNLRLQVTLRKRQGELTAECGALRTKLSQMVERTTGFTPTVELSADADDDAAEVAALEEEQILAFIRQLGLAKTKAKNVRRLAQILVTAYDGDVPQTFEELEALPGVGHKTASVVMAQAFGVPAFPVDTHIHRLAQRWGLSDGSNVARTEQDLKRLFPKEHWNRLHLQIIFWGREFCTARGCDGTVCSMCRELYPKRRRPVLTRKP